MKKTLRVIDPFFTAEVGDTFVFDENNKEFVSTHNEEFHRAGDNNIDSSYSSTFTISQEYAKELIREGYLEEVEEVEKDKPFVNIFDEINDLIYKYSNDLNNIDNELKDAPQCVKVEKTTVLTNIIKVLNHLKTLKK